MAPALIDFEYRPRASERAIERVYDALAPALGEGQVSRDPDVLLAYATDESGAGSYPGQILVRPDGTEDVVRVLEVCAWENVPVVPRGGGTGRAGGALAVEGGVVLALERMDRILEVRPESLTATAQPGVVTRDLMEAVEEQGLFYPPDPNSLESCHLGGNVATNAAGPRAVKYGVTGDYVRSLEVVLAGGRRIRTGAGRTLKHAAGYDLGRLLVGSEGTLGVITEITVRLRPRPRRVETALLFFPSLSAASRAVVEILRAGHQPRTLEMLDPAAIEAVRGKAPFRFPPGEQTALILELDGFGEEVFEAMTEIADLASGRLGASEVLVAQSEAEREDLWASRRILSPALRELRGKKYAEDVAVPLDAVPRMVERTHEIAAAEGLEAALYGHAGDGNLHVNLLFDSDDAWPAVMRAAEAIYREAVALGGTITGEHGVGLLKRGFLSIEQPPEVIEVQRRLKACLDPGHILNPGKILPP